MKEFGSMLWSQNFENFCSAICRLLAPEHVIFERYPHRPIKLTVPVLPDKAIDILVSVLVQCLSERIEQPVFTEEKFEGDYVQPTNDVSDGHSLILSTRVKTSLFPLYNSGLSYDAIGGLRAVALVATSPLVLIAHPSLGIQNFDDLSKYARLRPGTLNYVSSGVGSSSHLAMELLQLKAKIELTHISSHYDGSAADNLAKGLGQIAFDNLASVLPNLHSGKLKALAIADFERSTLAPTTPTFAELGVPDLEMKCWYGVAAPFGTPSWMIERLCQEILDIIGNTVVRQNLVSKGIEPFGRDASSFEDMLNKDVQVWNSVAKMAKMTPE